MTETRIGGDGFNPRSSSDLPPYDTAPWQHDGASSAGSFSQQTSAPYGQPASWDAAGQGGGWDQNGAPWNGVDTDPPYHSSTQVYQGQSLSAIEPGALEPDYVSHPNGPPSRDPLFDTPMPWADLPWEKEREAREARDAAARYAGHPADTPYRGQPANGQGHYPPAPNPADAQQWNTAAGYPNRYTNGNGHAYNDNGHTYGGNGNGHPYNGNGNGHHAQPDMGSFVQPGAAAAHPQAQWGQPNGQPYNGNGNGHAYNGNGHTYGGNGNGHPYNGNGNGNGWAAQPNGYGHPTGVPFKAYSPGTGVTNPGVPSPGMTNPGMTSPGMTGPGMTSPGMTNPGMTNPGPQGQGYPPQGPGVTGTHGNGMATNGAGMPPAMQAYAGPGTGQWAYGQGPPTAPGGPMTAPGTTGGMPPVPVPVQPYQQAPAGPQRGAGATITAQATTSPGMRAARRAKSRIDSDISIAELSPPGRHERSTEGGNRKTFVEKSVSVAHTAAVEDARLLTALRALISSRSLFPRVLFLAAGFAAIGPLALAYVEALSLPQGARFVLLPASLLVMLLCFINRVWGRRALTGYFAGVVATIVYDCVRWGLIPTGIWADPIPDIGRLLLDDPDAWWGWGYVWRFFGNGAGMGMAFTMLPWRGWKSGAVYGCVIATGLMVVLYLFPVAQAHFFPLTPFTFVGGYIGHIVYGAVLGWITAYLLPPPTDPAVRLQEFAETQLRR